MKQIVSVIVGVVAALALVVGFVALQRSEGAMAAVTNLSDRIFETFGAGPESTSDFQCYNGVCTYYLRQKLATATTSVCALRSPKATTTIVSAPTADIQSSASYATFYEFGKATTPFATTTSLGYLYVSANGYDTFVASSTPSTTDDGLIAPNTYFNFRIATSSTSATFAPTGSCQVILRGM